jgi:uncharacterized protein YfaS (alpha-2-macroglobulin family)
MRSALRILILTALAAPGIGQMEDTPYFSLSSSRTFGANGQPSVTMSAWNVDALEFRVYRVNDPVKFFQQLQDPHQFGGSVRRPSQKPTLLELLHGWKRGLRASIRRALRGQFTEAPSAHLEKVFPKKAPPAERGTHYAEAPVLNPQQLVLTFMQPVHSSSRWDSETVDIGVKDKGLYLVEAVKGDLRAYTILMVTDTVMVTKASPAGMLAYISNRTTGQPVAGADVAFIRQDAEPLVVKTNADGIAETQLAPAPKESGNLRIVARSGADVAVVVPWWWGHREEWSGYIYTDRPVYRPGHTVHFKAILRVRAAVGYDVPSGKTVNVQIQDPDQKPVYQKTLTTGANGTIQDQFDLPAGAVLGDYYIEVRGGEEQQMMGNFSVQEYKKPEYEVRVLPAKTHILQGEGVDAVIDARYYFGEPVAGAKVKYSVYRSRYWAPFWYEPDEDSTVEEGDSEGGEYDSEQIEQTDGQLDQDGKLTVHVNTTVSDKHHDYRYRIEAAVTDEGKREISGTGWVIASYGSFLVNVEPDRYLYRPGDKANFKVQSRDYANNPVETAVHVELRKWKHGERSESVGAAADVSTGADGTATAQLAIPSDASWMRVEVSARTPEGREVESDESLWITGGRWADWEGEGRQNVQIMPDRKSYRSGDIAKLLIVTGTPGTPVLVTVEGNRLQSTRVLRSKDATVLFEVPIKVEDEPGFFVNAEFMRDGERHQGSKRIKVPPDEHKLDFKISTDKATYLPGDTATYRIEATDSKGQPVARADLSLGVVDEAIYAIQRDTVPDMLTFFFGNAVNRVNTDSSLTYYFSGEAGKRRMRLAEFRPPSHLAQLKPERLVLPKVRKLFPDTAFWAADLTTDSAGVAVAKVPFPDSLTTWRATARGIAKDRVGNATLKTIVRKNLIMRLALPRFFVQGDEVVISGIVHNYLENAKTARISLDLAGLEVLEGKTKDVQIPSRGEVRVDWRVRAKAVRTATVKGQALTDEESDALELELPVNPPGVKLARAKGGSLAKAGSAEFNLSFPQEVQPGSRSLSIRVSPSIAGSLFGALEYLTSFPYGCVEQTMSSFLPNIIVKSAVKELGLKPHLDEAALEEKIRAGLDRLYRFQHEDGGWGWWETDDSHPFMTAYVIAGLVEARSAGTTIDGEAVKKGAAWLGRYVQQQSRMAPDLQAYIAYALTLAEDAQAPALRQHAYEQGTQLSPYGRALLGLAFERAKDGRANEMANTLLSSVTQDDRQAWWKATRDEMLDFDADVSPEATAYAVKFLSHQRADNPALPKAALWLMNHRNEGYWWESTKQTAMVIYGLTDFLKASNELKPHLSVTVSVNGRTVLTRAFEEATAIDAPEIKLDESKLAAGENAIRVTASGEGRLYYSARAEYFSTSQKLEKTGAVSLNILRDYFRLTPDKSGERIVYNTVPLSGPVASGDTIAVRLTVTGTDWKYLLIEDPIPAGTEFVSRDNLYEFKERPPWWQYWFTRREMHDDRMAIFQTYFNRGQREYFYLLKVVNPGLFTMSPARVQPMYQPDFLSTTETRRLEVK